MSYRVTQEVLEESRAELSDRLVLLAIAEIAYHDGIGWLPQDWNPGDSLEQRKRTIRWRARSSPRQVPRSIASLRAEALDELEVRTAQDGRRRILIYRVIVGRLRLLDVDLSRIPYRLDRPFSSPAELALPWARRPANLAGGQGEDAGSADGSSASASDERRPANLAGGRGADDLPSAPGRPANFDSDDLPSATGHARASVDPSLKARPGPVLTEASSIEKASVPAAAGEEELLEVLADELGLRPATRSEHGAWGKALKEIAEVGATADELRARCRRYRELWPQTVLTPKALSNQWTLLSAEAETSSGGGNTKEAWIEETSWRLVAEDAHEIVDGWPQLDPAQRSLYHERVDEVRAEHDELERRRAETGGLDERARLRSVAS